jgi:hypothetical protein
MAIDLEKQLAGLSPDARRRVENALNEAIAKEGAPEAAGFDRGPFDRSGYDRSTVEAVAKEFVAKEQGPPVDPTQ